MSTMQVSPQVKAHQQHPHSHFKTEDNERNLEQVQQNKSKSIQKQGAKSTLEQKEPDTSEENQNSIKLPLI